MSKYLVITTTLGSIRGMHAKEFVAGETVDLDDDDLAGIGLRDGWLCHVDDLDAALQITKARGGQVLNGPMDVPGGDRVAQCLDPQGGAFALHENAKS